MTDERDPTLDKAWRAHSREEPPPALNQAILAAAHRAVASGPQKVVPEATRPPRWWMPLAAAAAIGVVAIGLVQMSPPEQPALDTTSSARRPAEQILEDKSRVASVAEAPAAAPAPAANEPTDALRKQKAAGEGAAPTGAPRADANTNAVAPKVAPLPPPTPPESRANKRDAPAPEPFPAATPGRKAEMADDKRAPKGGDMPRDTGKFADDAVAPAQRQMAQPRASVDRESGARKESQSEATVAGALAQAPASAPPPPPAAPAPQKLAAEKDAAAPSVTRSRAPAPVEEKVGAAGGATSQLAKNQDMDEARMKARDPDAWIVRIRKLRDEGKTEDALRELREFRALVPDPERLLPPDLRDWKP